MKVLLVNHPNCHAFNGGDGVHLRETALALNRLGVETEQTNEAEPQVCSDVDLVHVFNLRTATATLKQLQAIKRSGRPVVMTPFYADMGLLQWGLTCVQGLFSGGATPDPRLLDLFKNRELVVNVNDAGAKHQLTRYTPYAGNGVMAECLRMVDYLLPSSFVEMDLLREQLRVLDVPFRVVPSAVNSEEFAGASPELFRERFGFEGDFILQVSRIESAKNQLFLAMALRDLDLPLVLVGRVLDENYFALVRQHGPKKLHVLGHLSHEELRSAYAAARVHLQPSWVETCGLTSLEAAVNDCNIVVSATGCEIEYFGNNARYCDPLSVESIRSAAVTVWENYDQERDKRASFRNYICREMTWEKSAKTTLDVYQQVLACR